MRKTLEDTHTKINDALSNIATAELFVDSNRPLVEVLSIIDMGLVNLHDAKVKMLELRNMVREQKLKDDKP